MFASNLCMDILRRSEVDAFIYMDGSPTCGVYRTTLKSTKRGHPPGIFGSLLLDQGYFLIPAADLQSPLRWWDWRRRLLAFYWLKNLQITGKAGLYDTWARLKFLFQELDNPWATQMGRRLADETHGDAYASVRELNELLHQTRVQLQKIRDDAVKSA